MTHKNSFIAVIKSNGKILRENNSTVAIPFSSEYSILLKNLTSTRAMAEITIDGESVTEGRKLILQPNSEFSIERFIKDGNLKSGNKFKFIEKTDTIAKNRGNKIDDGIVRIEIWKEKDYPLPIMTTYPPITDDVWVWKYPKYPEDYPQFIPKYQNGVFMTACNNCSTTPSVGILRGAKMTTTQNNVDGITVAGSYSKQQFATGDWFQTENESTVITFQLVGELKNNEPVLKPITVDIKPKCITCGKLNRATNKFCSECGTSLILY